MADVAEGLEDFTEDAEVEDYSVLARFVIDSSVTESAALKFLEKVKEHYGFSYEPLYLLGNQGSFDWNDTDKTKRGMARSYKILGLPTEGEADKFAAELEGKKGIDWAYRDIPIETDDDDPYLNTGIDINDKIESLMR